MMKPLTRAQRALLRRAHLLGMTYGGNHQGRTLRALEQRGLIVRVATSWEQAPGYWKLTPDGRVAVIARAKRKQANR